MALAASKQDDKDLKLPAIVNNRKAIKTKSKEADYYLRNVNDLLLEVNNKKELSAVLEAIRTGYLIYPSKEFIWSQFEKQPEFDFNKSQKEISVYSKYVKRYESKYENDFGKIKYLILSRVPIIELGQLNLCVNLVVLNLSHNYLTEIEYLSKCVHLVRLNLEGNQLLDLPSASFWFQMKQLRVLLLHNNPLNRLENLKYLAACPRLEILTLYDSPLCMKDNYRHHAVNSIWSLKALDHHVISDEEIIEEAVFDNRFKALGPNFRINLNLTYSDKEQGLKRELRATNDLISRVNRILAFNSPVLIIQKNIRRYLALKKYRAQWVERKIQAAIVIQKWWRKLNSKKQSKSAKAKSDSSSKSKKSSPHSSKKSQRLVVKIEDQVANLRNATPSLITDGSQKLTQVRIDMNRLNEVTRRLYNEENSNTIKLDLPPAVPPHSVEQGAESKDAFLLGILKENKIDLQKLIQLLQIMSMFSQNDTANFIRALDLNVNLDEFQKLKDSLEKIKDLHESQLKNLVEKDEDYYDVDEEEETDTVYRLPLLKSDLVLKDKDNLIVDVIREKFAGVKQIKKMEHDSHKFINRIKAQDLQENRKLVIDRQAKFVTNDQRFFQKNYGNMALGCLNAIDKAYMDRELIDRKLINQQLCDEIKEEERAQRQQVEYFKQDLIRETQNARKLDIDRLAASKNKEYTEYKVLKNQVQSRRKADAEYRQRRFRDVRRAVEFSKQHLSVSKALQKHEFLTLREEKLKKKTDFVNETWSEKKKQDDLIKNYLRQRNELRKEEALNEKKLVETRVKEERDAELYDAKKRVAYLKLQEMARNNDAPYSTVEFEPIKPSYYLFEKPKTPVEDE